MGSGANRFGAVLRQIPIGTKHLNQGIHLIKYDLFALHGPQTWNLAQTLHGHKFFEQSFTPKYSVNYNFLCQEEFNFYPHVTLICFYTHLCTHVSKFVLHWTKKIRHKRVEKKKQQLKITRNSVCWKLYFTQGRSTFTRTMSVRPWQIPCLPGAKVWGRGAWV